MAGQQRVVAVFGERSAAESAAASLKQQGFEPRIDVRDDEAFALQGQMRDEAANSLAGPGIGISPPEATKGFFKGSAAGTIGGLVVGVLVGVLYGVFSGASIPLSILICGIVGVVAGITSGLILGGGAGSRKEVQTGERPADTTGTTVGVDSLDDDDAERVTTVFGRYAPTRVDRVRNGSAGGA